MKKYNKKNESGLVLKNENEDLAKLVVKSISEQKEKVESYVVFSMYKQPMLVDDCEFDSSDFTDKTWKFLFSIIKKMRKDKKVVIDDITTALFVEGSDTLKKMYEKIGGWELIERGKSYVEVENFEGYCEDLLRYNLLITLIEKGYPIKQDVATYLSMGLEDIQKVFEEDLAETFSRVSVSEKAEDMATGYDAVIEEADEGLNRGFPYSSDMLTEETNGQSLGSITMVSANSGMGKTFFTVAQVLPKMIEFNENLLIMANEEDIKKWKREILTWVVNNILGGNFNKKRFNFGKFTKEEKDLLKRASQWISENLDEDRIKFVNFTSFSMRKAIKLTKEYSFKGYKYFILDTLKMDSDSMSDMQWLELSRNMVALFDVIKPANKNVHVYVTYQLGKSAMNSRYLSQNSLGVAKNVVDVVATLLLFRHATVNEKTSEGEANNEGKIRVYNSGSKITKFLDMDKTYFIVFIGKNRQGGTAEQLVYEVDMGRNIMKEYGKTIVPQDY